MVLQIEPVDLQNLKASTSGLSQKVCTLIDGSLQWPVTCCGKFITQLRSNSYDNNQQNLAFTVPQPMDVNLVK